MKERKKEDNGKGKGKKGGGGKSAGGATAAAGAGEEGGVGGRRRGKVSGSKPAGVPSRVHLSGISYWSVSPCI